LTIFGLHVSRLDLRRRVAAYLDAMADRLLCGTGGHLRDLLAGSLKELRGAGLFERRELVEKVSL
jgi:hypothetical protein